MSALNSGQSPVADSSEVRHLALFIPSLAGGGVARVMLNLAHTFSQRGHQVDLVVCRHRGAYEQRIPPGIRVVTLSPRSRLEARLLALRADSSLWKELLRPVLMPLRDAPPLAFLPDLVRYITKERPHAMLVGKTHTNLVAIWARQLAGVPMRLVVSEHSSLSQEIAGPKGRKWRWRFVPPLLKRAYPAADAIVTVSNGVAADLAACTGLEQDRMGTIYNPVFAPSILEQAREPVDHPWFTGDGPPVLLGVGRLEPQKDFATLLRAFARVREVRPARLVILGEGAERSRLDALARRLGISDVLSLPGFVSNPYAHMARADVLILSSRYEGLGNVVIEALACGCPVVSTDCPSGPAEILDHGRYGRLVPVNDDARLAAAILATLDDPIDRNRLQRRAAQFSIENAAQRYLETMLPNTEAADPQT